MYALDQDEVVHPHAPAIGSAGANVEPSEVVPASLGTLELRDSSTVLDFLTLPPRVAQRALDDLHALAEGMRRLTERDGDLSALLASVRVLPQTEDELSARIDSLHTEVRGLREWLEPLHRELTDLDETAESLESALSGLRGEIVPLRGELERVGAAVQGFREDIKDLRGRIPGI